ncbi:MAG: CopG family transcriptional regulator [Lachnospiraceae bacterium]|jgi:hypothetical protein|nr:CopG family transcriptional regulator [Lachnospiraceae bacterium]
MARTGRPKSDKPKDSRIVVRFTAEEVSRMKGYADKNGLTITELVRKGVWNLLES